MSDRKPPKDTNELAAYILRVTTGETEKIEAPKKNPKFKALSDLGSSKGGTARKDSLTPEKRKEIAKKAAKARWANKT
ncbi:MAG: histone H1 [Pyrinomonadaceae bacterium]